MSNETPRQTGGGLKRFFARPAAPAKKRDDLSPPLAVPLSEEVPQVKEMEMGGAGISFNSFTNETKKVKQGKNATKGRGVIGNKRTLTNIPNEDELAEDLKKLKNMESDEDDVDDINDVDDANLQEDFEKEVQDRFLQNHDMTLDKNKDTSFKPKYVNDVNSSNTITTLRRLMSKRKRESGDVPQSFYIRRETTPVAFEIPKPQVKEPKVAKGRKEKQQLSKNPNCDYALQSEKREDDEEEIEQITNDDGWSVQTKHMAQIITFHSDGSFEWPKSSPFKCWNCCEHFSGPPAMIPRHYNYKYNFYEVYGNFCGWPCAKRFDYDSRHEFHVEKSPSLDYFAWKYFGVMLPIPAAPCRFLLDTFSSFGMSLERYRAVGKVQKKTGVAEDNFVLLQPPVVPYELMVCWDERKPKRKKIKTGYDDNKRKMFEEQMRGNVPVPKMPNPIVHQTTLVSDPITNEVTTKTVLSTKYSNKTLFTKLSNQDKK